MSSVVESLNAVSPVWLDWVIAGAIQAAVLGLTIVLIVRLLRRRSAPLRYTLLLLAVAKFLVPPMAAMPFGIASHLPVFTPQARSLVNMDAQQSGEPEERTLIGSAPVSERAESDEPGLRARLVDAGLSKTQVPGVIEDAAVVATSRTSLVETPHEPVSLTSWLLLLHAFGTVCVVVVTIRASWRLHQLIGSAAPAQGLLLDVTQSIARGVRVRVSPDVTYPFSCGVLHPTVIVPAVLSRQLSRAQLDAVMRHEIAHHRRGDLLVNWLQVVTKALWWFHPVLSIVNRDLRRVREECCDDRLLARGEVSDEVYSETLLAVARCGGRGRAFPLTASMADGRHPLSERLERILDPHMRRSDRLGFRGIAAVVVAGLLLLPGVSAKGPGGSVPVTQSDQNEAWLISGTVRDRSGSVVDNARVQLITEEGWSQPKAQRQVKTDVEGRFELNVPSSDLRLTPMTEVHLVAFKDGHGVGHTQTRGRIPLPDAEVTLTENTAARYRILDSNGKPVAAARIQVGAMENTGLRIPRDQAPGFLSATTNQQGDATVRGVASESITALYVTSAKFGLQTFRLYRGNGVPEEIRLKPVGRVVGRVEVPTGVDPTQIQFNLGTYRGESAGPGKLSSNGSAVSRPDRSGRFVIPAISGGQLRGRIVVPTDFSAVGSLPTDVGVSAGQESRLVVRFEPGVRVTRRLITKESGQPIAGVEGSVQGQGLYRKVRTKSDGRFTVWLKPNATYHTVFDLPYGYLQQNKDDRNTKVGSGDTVLPDLAFMEAKQISGTVVDAAGKPQADVRLLANWKDPEENFGFAPVDGLPSRGFGQSRQDGTFQIRNVHPSVTVTLTPLRHGVRVGRDVQVPKDAVEATVKLDQQTLVSLSGRIANAGMLKGQTPICRLYANFAGTKSDRGRVMATTVSLQSDGSFRTGAHFPDDYAYRLIVFVNRSEVASTKWMVPKHGSSTFAPVMVPTAKLKSRAVAKKRQRFEMSRTVIDSAGNPVPNAPVVAWYLGSRLRLQTNDQGKLTLSGVPDSGAWVFVDAPGFRFTGQFAERSDSRPIRIVRKDEADPGGPMRTLKTNPIPPALLERATTGLTTTLDLYTKRPGIQEFRKERARDFASRIAPNRIRVDGNEISQVSAMARKDFEQALARIKQTDGGQQLRLMGYALRKVSTLTAEQKSQFVNIALPLLKDAGPEDLTFWGDLLIEQGQSEVGRNLLDRALRLLPAVDDSDRAPFTRGYWAWTYAPFDYKKSLEVIKDITDSRKRTRYLTNIAHQLADVDPRAAESVLNTMDHSDDAALKVVARMATKDAIRSRRIAFDISDPKTRARALARVADCNPGAKDAKSLVARAYNILTAETNAGDRGPRSSLPIAVSLLPTVERVVPDELNEYFWRTLSLRRNVSYGNESRALGPHGKDNTMRFADPVLALALSRYDRKVARQITLDPEDETLDLGAEHGPYRFFAALAVLDPATAVTTAESLPTETDRQVAAKMSAWQQITEVLSTGTREQFKSVVERQYLLRDPRIVDF